MTSGPLLFARYAYPPNALGYCGPDDDGSLLDYGAAGFSDGGLVARARGFEGAWPYLELIAAACRIDDPLDPRVVGAYWVGSSLLDHVDLSALGPHLEERFRGRAGRAWSRFADAVPAGAVPHHSFHVFCVYPWVGLMRTGAVDHPLRVLDRCRIRWGRVQAVSGDLVTVRCRPLVWDGRALAYGPATDEHAFWAHEGRAFVRDLRAGEWVSLHWDWVCDRLPLAQLSALRAYTDRHLAMANRSLADPVLSDLR